MAAVLEERLRLPRTPRVVADLGVDEDLVFQLAIKMLHYGELKGAELASRLGVPFTILEPFLDRMRRDHLCAVVGSALVGSPSYVYRLTEAGRLRASAYLAHNHYVGAVPVPLDQYQRYVAEDRAIATFDVTRRRVRQALSDLVLSDAVLDKIGPAVAARQSLFLYGPPGNGKTLISHAIRNLFPDSIAIPHALSVDGHIIRFFDPSHHEPVGPPVATRLESETDGDQRWILCRRPLVVAGGELTIEALDLGFSPTAGFYRPPLQALANGGVIVIDDFGRQRVSPPELLNRWIGPLERRLDYLTLQTGQQFEFPFDVLVIFATNLKPSDLVDEAFLRRMQYKVFVEPPTVDGFIEIFERCCADRNLAFDRELVDHLLEHEVLGRGIPLRACQPRDLIEHALTLAGYLEEPRRLTQSLLEAACDSYFLQEHEVEFR